MAETLKILVVEDEEKNFITVQTTFSETIEKLKSWELLNQMGFQELEIEWVKGDDHPTKKRGKEYYFYTDKVLEDLEKKVENKESKKICILLDVILTKQEQEKCDVNEFKKVELSRKIYDRFESQCNLYLITGIRSFGTLAFGIFGRENMKDQYIPRELVGDYASFTAISQALYWLNNGKVIPKELLRKIEDKELQE